MKQHLQLDSTRMKIALLTRSNWRSPRFLAGSLSRMLTTLDIDHTVFLEGIGWLESWTRGPQGLRDRLHINQVKKNIQNIEKYDIIILVDTLQSLRDTVSLEPLRTLGKPVLLHSVFYLGGSAHWLERLPAAVLEKFDAFLNVSGIHDISPQQPEKYFPVGLNLSPAALPGSGREFVALLDFPREGYQRERDMQIRVLESLGVPVRVLDGEYSFDEIEQEYNRVSLAFVAFPEAFGVPIVQLQYAGAVIASPEAVWVKRHALLPSGSAWADVTGPAFTDNFLIYANEQDLHRRVAQLRDEWSPETVRQRLLDFQPAYVNGNVAELKRALEQFSR
jgi:hypothetical protein